MDGAKADRSERRRSVKKRKAEEEEGHSSRGVLSPR
jgi:hypothetical protein